MWFENKKLIPRKNGREHEWRFGLKVQKTNKQTKHFVTILVVFYLGVGFPMKSAFCLSSMCVVVDVHLFCCLTCPHHHLIWYKHKCVCVHTGPPANSEHSFLTSAFTSWHTRTYKKKTKKQEQHHNGGRNIRTGGEKKKKQKNNNSKQNHGQIIQTTISALSLDSIVCGVLCSREEKKTIIFCLFV